MLRFLIAFLLIVQACKTTSITSDSKMIGGHRAINYQFPSAIQFKGCSGNKIGEYAFLTAAHCVMDKSLGTLRSDLHQGSRFSIRHGINLKDATEFSVQVRFVAVHHSYIEISKQLAGKNAKDKDYQSATDIAVIVVDELTPGIGTAVLSDQALTRGSSVVVSGYGCNELRNDPLNPLAGDGTIVTEDLEFDPNTALKYAAVKISKSTDQHGAVPDERNPFGELRFKLCPGDSGSGAFAIKDREEAYTEQELRRMTFNQLIGVNSFISPFDSYFTKLGSPVAASSLVCIRNILGMTEADVDANGLHSACQIQRPAK